MPLIYVGKYTLFQGRPLWEIVMNLKDFGVGRLVGRNIYRRYPEATYFRVLQVNPLKLEYPEVSTTDVRLSKSLDGKTNSNGKFVCLDFLETRNEGASIDGKDVQGRNTTGAVECRSNSLQTRLVSDTKSRRGSVHQVWKTTGSEYYYLS